MHWHGNTLIFQHNDDGCAASYSGDVTPTEDDYTNGKTSTKDYKPGTCCIATVKILGENCRAMDGSNASKWSKSRFTDCCKHFSLVGVAGES